MEFREKLITTALLFILWPTVPTGAAETDFTGMTDAEVLLHENSREALQVYRERSAEYTLEHQHEVMEAYQKARLEKLSRDGASGDVLLERMNTVDDPIQLQNAQNAFRSLFLAANEEEKAILRERFLGSWRELPLPQSDDWSGMADMRFSGYLHLVQIIAPHESEALPILTERCVDSGLHEGTRRMYATLVGGAFELGPLTAAKAESVYLEEFEPVKVHLLGNHSYALLESTLFGVLGKCGESGLEALRRMGVLNTPRGLEALSTMHTPEAEELLWEMAESSENHPLTVLKSLNMLWRFQYKDPKPDRLSRLREPLSAILAAPEPGAKPNLKVLERAVQLAVKTGDAHYHGYIVRMERDLDPAALEQADIENAGGLDRELHPQQYTSESLLDAIHTAKNALR